ncbi:MAG TPA: hypothetical protein DIU15_18910 [Deltaproteobacteria bacterium]|nr:hypothetical protein [Deltaproteobacteria bacterium]HCP48116.1 hypothetical protein [Deltaproteobacteria bacterium]
MRRNFFSTLPSILLVGSLMSGCPQGRDGQPESIDALEASASCSVDGEAVTWSFSFRVEGPASEGGTKVYVNGPDSDDSTGFVMPVIGEDAQGRLEFATTVSGTPAGSEPSVGDVPFSCDEELEVQVQFCATHSSTLDQPCWACGEDDGASPPGGAVDWVRC